VTLLTACTLHTQATIFGPYDGEGVSIVFYFALPPGFDPAALPNQKALALYKRFLVNGREADGTPTRDRCAGDGMGRDEGWGCENTCLIPSLSPTPPPTTAMHPVKMLYID
jgi:hypothetical protein